MFHTVSHSVHCVDLESSQGPYVFALTELRITGPCRLSEEGIEELMNYEVSVREEFDLKLF